jgi:hypothetical protein
MEVQPDIQQRSALITQAVWEPAANLFAHEDGATIQPTSLAAVLATTRHKRAGAGEPEWCSDQQGPGANLEQQAHPREPGPARMRISSADANFRERHTPQNKHTAGSGEFVHCS